MKKQERITSKGQATVPRGIRRTRSPFEKYRGMGSPGIPHGKKAVVKWVRKLRG